MKKILFFFALITLTQISCNSDDVSDNDIPININLEINQQNLLGKWFLKGGTINGGSFESHQHKCTSLKDYQEFLSDNNINFVEYDVNCEIVDAETSGYYLEGNKLTIVSFDPVVSQDYVYTIISITQQELILKQTANTPDGVETYEIYFTRN